MPATLQPGGHLVTPAPNGNSLAEVRGARAMHTDQVAHWWQFTPPGWGLLAWAALILTVSVGGCGASSSSHGEPGPSSSAQPTATIFTRLGYRFAPPAGWITIPGTLDWGKMGGQPAPGAPQFDTFELSTGTRFESVLFGSQAAPRRISVDKWIAHLSTIGELAPDCSTVLLQSAARLGGEAAISQVSWCPPDGPDAVLDRVFAIHHGQGWMPCACTRLVAM
jgi:hypothetical protein